MLKSWFLSRKFCFVFSSYVISVLYIFSNFKACLGFHNIINKGKKKNTFEGHFHTMLFCVLLFVPICLTFCINTNSKCRVYQH